MKKEKKVWAFTLLALWWLSPNTINAQQDSVRVLGEVVISATRMEQPLITAARSVSVITRETIERSVYNSPADLLSAEMGIYVVGATQTPGMNQSVFLRGTNSNQTVVLIDGLRISDPSSPNGTIDLSEISLTDIERIEIIRGAHSTLYGGSAMGGAINIITRKGGASGLHGSVQAQAGTFGEKSLATNGSINLQYRWKNGWYANGSTFNQRVAGLNATEDTITTPRFRPPDNDVFVKNDYYVKTGRSTEWWNFFIAGKKTSQKADIDDRAYDDDDNAFLAFDRSLLEYQGSLKVRQDLSITFLGSYSKSKRHQKNDSSLVAEGVYDRTFGDDSYHARALTNELVTHYNTRNVKLVAGAGHYDEQMEFNTFYFSKAGGYLYETKVNYDSIEKSTSTIYGFGQLSIDVKKLNLRFGTRYNHHSVVGDFFTFEVNPSYQVSNALLYASLSTGYNAPSLYQLYDPSTGSDPEITRGNKNLNAEKSVSVELGFKKEFDNGSYFTVSGYTTSVSNVIEYVYLWRGGVPVSDLSYLDYVGDRYLNISRQIANGVEMSGRWNSGKFYLQGNLSVMKGRIVISPLDISDPQTGSNTVQLFNYGAFAENEITVNSLARRPRFMGIAEVGYRINDQLTIYSSIRRAGTRNDVEYNADAGPFGALGERRVAEYNLLDAGINYVPTRHLSVSLRVENITDEEYREIYGFRSRGRSGYLKISYSW